MADETSKAPPAARHRHISAKPVGAYLPRIAKAAFEAHGFPGAAILSDWPAIAGASMAAFTLPERLVWPRRRDDRAREDQTASPQGHRQTGATLVLRVDGPRALEVQHDTPRIIERVNTYFGYRAVAQLRIVQGPVARQQPPLQKPRAQAKGKAPDERTLERIENDRLRNALARLGTQLD